MFFRRERWGKGDGEELGEGRERGFKVIGRVEEMKGDEGRKGRGEKKKEIRKEKQKDAERGGQGRARPVL